jgi:hypothetical protein
MIPIASASGGWYSVARREFSLLPPACVRCSRLAALSLLICVGACTGSGRPRNADCVWPPDPSRPLDLHRTSDQRHLSDDALLAEDLAIRYGDAVRWSPAGPFRGTGDYRQRELACMETLFGVVAQTHGVSTTEVREALAHRPWVPDLIVILSFAVFFGRIAHNTVGRVRRRFDLDERRAALWSLVAMSLALSFAGVVLLELWAVSVEMLRIGNDHMGQPRGARVPWGQHRLLIFTGGVLLFWMIAVVRYKIAAHSSRSLST